MGVEMKQFMGRSETVALEWFARLLSLPAMIAAVAIPINHLTQPGATFEVSLQQVVEASTIAPGVHYAETTSAALVILEVANLPWWLRLASEAGFALTWFAIGFGALMVSRVLSTIAWGDPFDHRNPRRIALIGGCVLVGAMLAPAVRGEARMAILMHLDVTDVSADIDLQLLPILVAALIFVVAGAFQRGSQLTADTEGLV